MTASSLHQQLLTDGSAYLLLSFRKQLCIGCDCGIALLGLQHAPHPIPLHGTHTLMPQAAQLQLTFILSLGLPAQRSRAAFGPA